MNEYLAAKSRPVRWWACWIPLSCLVMLVWTGCGGPLPGAPVVTIERDGPGTLSEGEAAQFIIQAQPAPAADLVVSLTVTESGDTLATSPSAVTIAAGATSATLTVGTVDDGADEPDSVVTATVRDGSGYTVGAPREATVTVTDDDDDDDDDGGDGGGDGDDGGDVPDQPTVTISAVDSSVIEGEAVRFTVRANPAPTADLEVTVSWIDPGGFLDGSQPTSLTITTTGTATLTANTIDDTTEESNSTVTAMLSLPDGSGYTLSPVSARVTVRDNDGDPEVTISRAGASQVTEGTAVQFTVTATPAPTADLEVTVSWSDPGGFLDGSQPTSLTITTTGTATLTANTIDDTTEESNSTVTAMLSLPDGSGYTLSPGSARVTVRDNDGDPEVTISPAGASQVTEGTAVQFTVTATPAPTADLEVTVSWSDPGGFLDGSQPTSLTITTTGTATLTANTIDDTTEESNRTVTATLNAGTGYAVGVPSSANVTVTDNDGTGPPTTVTVSLASVTPSTVEEGGSLKIVLAIDGAPSTQQDGGVYALDIVEDVGVPGGEKITNIGNVAFRFDASDTTVDIHPQIMVPNTEEVEMRRTVRVVINPAFAHDYSLGAPSARTVNVTDVP